MLIYTIEDLKCDKNSIKNQQGLPLLDIL